MLLPIPKFSLKYPYINFKFSDISFITKTVYEKYSFGNDGLYPKNQLDFIKLNKSYLTDNNVPINMVRFIFQPHFTYDVIKNVINPKLDVSIPINIKDGTVNTKLPTITTNSPKQLISLSVLNYSSDDNYKLLRDIIVNCKIGVVIYINENENQTVDSDVIQFSILDIEVYNEKYFN